MLYPVLDLYIKTKLNPEVPGQKISIFVNKRMSRDEIENMRADDIMDQLIERNASEILGLCLGANDLDSDSALRMLKKDFDIRPVMTWIFDDGSDKNG